MNKHPALALLLCGTVLLSGCSSLLIRDYTVLTVHSAAPTVEGDQLTIRVESYQDLVNALLYFITEGRESGTIRLYNYPNDVAQDLELACQEVSSEDPLGAYAVDSIQYTVSPIVAYYEAKLQLTYRRTHEQVSAVIPATGSTAIREALRTTLSGFQEEAALRISYFDWDEAYIRTLLRQAYLSTPATALDYPQATIYSYPDSGRQRIVELLLDYNLDQKELSSRKKTLNQLCTQMTDRLWDATGDDGLLEIRQAILDTAEYNPEGGSTAYHALSQHSADSLGLAFSMALLCHQLEYTAQVVEGTLNGQSHSWNVILTDEGYRHLDLSQDIQSAEDSPFRSDRYMAENGYSWNKALVPLCGEQPVS